MRRALPNWIVAVVATFASFACASLPPDPDGGSVDVGAPDAERDAGARACPAIERDVSNRNLIVFGDARPSEPRIAWTFTIVRVDGAESLLELALVGDLEALEDTRDVVTLGGAEADLATCRHCVLLWPGCDTVPENCLGAPWVPVEGRAFVFQTPSSDAETELDVELADLVFAPSTFRDTPIGTTPDEGDACAELDTIRLAGRVEETDCTFSRVACALRER